MSNLTQGHFDFTGVDKHAAYLSCFTPDSVEDYWLPAVIPAESRYHLVGCHNLAVMARCNFEPILLSYIKASEARSETIVDLCLPFFDEQLRRTFLGRYILHGGKLIGIRFSTTAVHPAFSAWPRHRAKQISVRLLGKQYDVLVGEIALYLTNLRIGLLFQSEIETSTQEYVNCGFDLIALTYECRRHTSTAIALKNDLSKQVMFLQAELGLPQRRISEESIRTMLFGDGTFPAASRTIFMGYFDFSKHFEGKRQLYLSQRQKNFITPLEVNASFSQNEVKVQFKSPHYELSLGSLPCVSMPNNKFDINQYLRRIYLYFYRSGHQRIVVMVEDSPVSVCFLFIVQQLVKRQEKGSFGKRFDFANIVISKLSSLEGRFPLLKFQLGVEQKIAERDEIIQRVNFFNFMVEKQSRQSYFPVVTADPITVNVLRMLNSQEEILLVEGDCNASKSFSENSSCECLTMKEGILTTWIATEFFTFQELRQLYHSPDLLSFIDDEEYHLQLWEKYVKQNGNRAAEVDRSLERIEGVCLNQPHRLEDMLRKESLFAHQFQEHYNRVKEACYQGSKEKIYSHFLFRKLTKIEEHSPRLEFSNQIMSELLLTPEASIMKVFKFISSRRTSLFSRLSSRLTLDAIACAREEFQRKIACHRCKIHYLPELMYTCRTKICRQSFCYECLLKFQSQQEQALLIEDIQHLTMLKLCPICKGNCANCKACEAKRAKLIELKQNCVCPIETECHYCKRSSALFQFTCSREDCKKTYCLRCIEEGFRSRNNDYMKSNWVCFACENRCNCNQCEREKAKIMSLKAQKAENKVADKEKESKITIKPLKSAALTEAKQKKDQPVLKDQALSMKKTNEQRLPAQPQKDNGQSEFSRGKAEKPKSQKVNYKANFCDKKIEQDKTQLKNSVPPPQSQQKPKEKGEGTSTKKIDPLEKWRKIWEKSVNGDDKH